MRRGPRLPLEELAPYLFPTEPPAPRAAAPALLATPLDWGQVFGNANPVEIEVGFGKGLFLVNSGASQPERNFFGIEIERKYVLYTATRLAKRRLANVKVACADALCFLLGHVTGGSVAAMHVYFPDPWWKKRHRKRRLFTIDFAMQCVRVLRPGGVLHLVSDVEEYFAETAKMLASFGELAPLPEPTVQMPQHDLDYLTNFERKYRQEGRPIYRGDWHKVSGHT